MSGRTHLEHLGQVRALGNGFSCSLCGFGASLGFFGSAVNGYTYHYYATTIRLRPGDVWVRWPAECLRGRHGHT